MWFRKHKIEPKYVRIRLEINIFHKNNKRCALYFSPGGRMGYPAWKWCQTESTRVAAFLPIYHTYQVTLDIFGSPVDFQWGFRKYHRHTPSTCICVCSSFLNTQLILSDGNAASTVLIVRWPVTSILKENRKPLLPSEYTSGAMSLDRLAAVPADGTEEPCRWLWSETIRAIAGTRVCWVF